LAGTVLRITEAPALLRDQALERLRDAIISGHFAPGTRLIERELCEQMGVSRTSIREVLRGLEAEHLITVEPRRGPIVARLTRKQVAEIYDVRALLESTVVRIFTQKAGDEEIAHLRILYDKLYIVRRSGDVAAIAKAATEFSGYMLKIADHELIGDLYRKLIARMSALRGVSISQPGRLAQAASELAAVMSAIERRDAESAAQCFAVHVRNAGEAALARIDAGPLPSYVAMHDQPA
jgi:GntR family transcriptional regulator, trigonelline degradation regulator